VSIVEDHDDRPVGTQRGEQIDSPLDQPVAGSLRTVGSCVLCEFNAT
jgi:hypothetical protein